MGKGDKKTAKGKRSMGSYGNTRKRKSDEKVVIDAGKAVKKEKKAPVVKKAAPAAAKKVAPKKAKAE